MAPNTSTLNLSQITVTSFTLASTSLTLRRSTKLASWLKTTGKSSLTVKGSESLNQAQLLILAKTLRLHLPALLYHRIPLS